MAAPRQRTGPLRTMHDADDSLDERSLPEVLRRAAEGDQQAWRQLVEAYSGRVFALIRAQCGDSELSEEIAQSTFCTVASKLGDYVEHGRFEPWLFRIAMNRLRDEMRRRRRQAIPVEGGTLASLAGGEEIAEPVDDGASDALREAMERLSEADRRVIHLRHVAGLGFRQIAEILDQPLGTVLARQHRALKKLRALLSHLEPGPDDDRV